MNKIKQLKNKNFTLYFEYSGNEKSLNSTDLKILFKELDYAVKSLDLENFDFPTNLNWHTWHTKILPLLSIRRELLELNSLPNIKSELQRVIRALNKFFKSVSEIELFVHLCGRGKITTLNKNYLGKNKSTDVISFPVHDINLKDIKDIPQNFPLLSLGDIFICKEVAIKAAKENNVTLSEEFRILLIHGILHLLGFDHDLSKMKGSMKEKKKRAALMFWMEALLFYKLSNQ
ncbi:MAG: rRNA maturation RNase YbeY [Oligoflexia bacterium]|nr:rRNA maturation RNase YbeY [Oligoflexia bacterium]